MNLQANDNKKIEILVNDKIYYRYAIKTHFIKIGENYIDILNKYIKATYKNGDIVLISEKIISLCQRRVIYKKNIKLSKLAIFLSKFASKSKAGIGVNNPYKMQVAIDICGKTKVIYAAISAGVGKILKKKGIFYNIVGDEISGLDGFTGKFFPEYEEFGIKLPKDSNAVCDEIYNKLGIECIIADANDFSVKVLGKSKSIKYSDLELSEIIKDNPAGQSNQLTPLVLIREKVR